MRSLDVGSTPAGVAVAAPAQRLAARPRIVKLAAASGSKSTDPIHDGRLPFLQTFEQFSRPGDYAAKVLAGHKFAWGKSGMPNKDALFIADVDAARSIMASELQLGVGGDWPDTIRAMLGHSSISMTTDLELHSRLRQYLGMAFTEKSVQAMLPDLQSTVAAHMKRWASATSSNTTSSNVISSTGAGSAQAVGLATTADGSMVLGYPAVRTLTFEVLVNRVLGLRMSHAEVEQYAGLFEQLVDGFAPPAWDLPFTAYGKGLKARQQLTERIQQTLSSPQCTGALARLRDEFGADSPVAIDNTITLLFAGFDTISSSLTYMLWVLAQHPDVVQKLHNEQAAVIAENGDTLTPDAYKAMPYAMAVIKETLRLAQIISYVPRMATKGLPVPEGPTMSAGCPFLVALSAISCADPTLQQAGDQDQFRPERWLEPGAAKNLSQYQLPFGTGQRTCLGMHLANAEMIAVLAELSRSYTLTADWQTDWKDFSIKRPDNGLPLRLAHRAGAAVDAAATALPSSAAAAAAAV